MANPIDKLDAAISEQLKGGGSIGSMTKDQFLDYIDVVSGAVKNNLKFFTELGPSEKKMKEYLKAKPGDQRKSIAFYNAIYKEMQYAAKKAMDERFLGAFADTLASFAVILDEIAKNVDEIFQNKSINLFNSKVSHAAVIGMIVDAEMFGKFIDWYITLFMSEVVAGLPRLLPYQMKYLEEAVKVVPALINRIINGRSGSNFINNVLNYKNGGSDVLLVNGNNQSNAKFAKVAGGVTDADIEAGARGIGIFKKIGDWFVTIKDEKMRRLRSERDLMQARVQLLKLELDGVDPESPEYKKQLKIIENYTAIIARIDQKLDKYYNS